VINKSEDFNDHTYHDVLFSDGVWGNGILRLRQKIDFLQTTEFFTDNNDFGWIFGDPRSTAFESTDGNIWLLGNDNRLTYYDLSSNEYEKYPEIRGIANHLLSLKEFTHQNRRYLIISYSGAGTIIYDINNTPLDVSDDPVFADYADKVDFEIFEKFSDVNFDSRGDDFAFFANVNNTDEAGEPYYFIRIDTNDTIMNLSDDSYVTWGLDDGLFEEVIDNDFTALYFDQEENIFYGASYYHSLFQCTDSSTPENKDDDSCQQFTGDDETRMVYSIIKDTNGYYWFGGNQGLTRINRNDTLTITDDTLSQIISSTDLSGQHISQIKWIAGEYPVGDEIWMMTRSGYIKALEFNYTYDDSLDDTHYNYKIENLANRQGGFSQFVMPDKNSIYTSLQGYGLQKISLTRSFEDTNKIEMLPIPPDGILAINYIDLSQVLGTVTAGSPYSFNELVSYEVSNDSGVNWFPITEGERVQFPTPDYKLKLRINLSKGSSPIIDLIGLSYITYPNTSEDQCDININSKAPVLTGTQSSGTNSITVNFIGIANETSIQNYVLEYGLTNTVFDFTPVTLSSMATSYTVTGLNPNVTYYFRLKAVSDCTESALSNVLSGQLSLSTTPTTTPTPTSTSSSSSSSAITTPTLIPTSRSYSSPSPLSNSTGEYLTCGQACQINSDCQDPNNICQAGVCQLDSNFCPLDQQLSDDGCTCVQETSTGGMCAQSCNSNLQCTEANNRCVNGICQLISCPEGSRLNDLACGCIPSDNNSFISDFISKTIQILKTVLTSQITPIITVVLLLIIMVISILLNNLNPNNLNSPTIQKIFKLLGLIRTMFLLEGFISSLIITTNKPSLFYSFLLLFFLIVVIYSLFKKIKSKFDK
jgi:hypothetical protein